MKTLRVLIVSFVLFLFSIPIQAIAWVRGIYLTQYTVMVNRNVQYYIKMAKELGIDTFVIDYERPSRKYAQNIALIKQNRIHYVARIVMFPNGGMSSQIKSPQYLAKRYRQIMEAVALGADEIQLDYIRYNKSQRASSQNARDIYQIIQQVEKMLDGKNTKLQIDIFGVAAHSEYFHIGQNVPLFAPSLDAICPMVYPSHYEPFRFHAVRPYQTIYNSLTDLRKQLANYPNVKIYAYIELHNYRFPLGRQNKMKYISEEIRAVRDAHGDGWYAWSPNNKYKILFALLAEGRDKPGMQSASLNPHLEQALAPTLPMPR